MGDHVAIQLLQVRLPTTPVWSLQKMLVPWTRIQRLKLIMQLTFLSRNFHCLLSRVLFSYKLQTDFEIRVASCLI